MYIKLEYEVVPKPNALLETKTTPIEEIKDGDTWSDAYDTVIYQIEQDQLEEEKKTTEQKLIQERIDFRKWLGV